MKIKDLRKSFLALSICILAGTSSTNAQTESNIFKGTDFLKWKPKSQAFYIEASVGMASLVAAQNNKKQATCIDDWYYSNQTVGNNYILDVMRKNSTYHPRGVILAAIEKKCESLSYSH